MNHANVRIPVTVMVIARLVRSITAKTVQKQTVEKTVVQNSRVWNITRKVCSKHLRRR
jgi:Na+-translocating ferredoxin:NAD+ oxidoreductase RnfE subunit